MLSPSHALSSSSSTLSFDIFKYGVSITEWYSNEVLLWRLLYKPTQENGIDTCLEELLNQEKANM